jgi:pyruvate dehydrogenase E1 component
MFELVGWRVVTLKYGKLLEAAFAQPDGEQLRQWIDACPNSLYSALVYMGGPGWREALTRDLNQYPGIRRILEQHDDAALHRLMTNLAGNDMQAVLDAFEGIDDDRPTCFIAYTIKGQGLPFAGHKDNHSGLMTPAQMETFRAAMNIRPGHEWDAFEGLHEPPEKLRAFLSRVPFAAAGERRLHARRIAVPDELPVTIQPKMATQVGFGALLNEIARGTSELAARIVTASPDVTVSTNLGPWVNRRRLFAREAMADTFKGERIPSTFTWEFSPSGQHIELGIAEMNLFILLSALGLSHTINGERLLPIGTLYDPFIARGLDALNYACYQDARFILVATPSGITLSPEGGAHQSIAQPLIGLAQDGLAAFEPAFVDELAAILAFALDYIQRDEEGEASERNWLRDETGGSIYLRLSTRPIEQISRTMTPTLRQAIVDGAYWLREPGPNCQVVVAYTGAVVPEAIHAVGLMAEDRRDVGLLAVTSADRLNAGWTAAQRARERGLAGARSHIERLFADLPSHCGIVTVLDGHPATLAWLGAVGGHRVRSLGVEHFGQTGSLVELYRHYGLDTNAIIAAAEMIAPGSPIRHLRAL